jgi:hypothetical protein
MKRFFIVLLLITLGCLFAQNKTTGFGITAQINQPVEQGWETQTKKDAIMANLKVLEENYLTQLSKRQYLEATMLIEEIKDILNGNQSTKTEVKTEVNTDVNSSVNTDTQANQSVNINMNISGFDNPAAPQPVTQDNIVKTEPAKIVQANEAMNSSSFQQLVSNIEDEAFAEDQLRYVRTAAKKHYFSVSQTEQLIDLFTFSEEKLECLRIIFPKVVDKDNAFTIISHFTYEDDKRTAESIINQ